MADPAHGQAPVHMPDPTPWPMVMALGATLLPGGVVLGPRLGPEDSVLGLVPLVSVVGLVLLVLALYRLIREDIDQAPHGGH